MRATKKASNAIENAQKTISAKFFCNLFYKIKKGGNRSFE